MPRRPAELTGTLEQPGGLLVAFTVGLTAAGTKTATHQAGEGATSTALPGSLTLIGPAATSRLAGRRRRGQHRPARAFTCATGWAPATSPCCARRSPPTAVRCR